MNKKTFLGSLLMLSLVMIGCNANDKSSKGKEGNPAFSFDEEKLNTVQEIHTENQLKYLNMQKEYYSMGKADLDNCDAMGNKNVSQPLPVKLDWEYEPDSNKTLVKYSVVFGQKSDLSDGYEVSGTKEKSLQFYNAFLGTNYFKVVAN